MHDKAPRGNPETPLLSDLLLVASNVEEADRWLAILHDSGWQGRGDILTHPAEMHARCQSGLYRAVLLDPSHPELNPSLTAELLRRLGGHPPVVLIMDAPGEPEALEGLANGAFDYVFRACLSRLPLATLRAIEAAELRVDLEGSDLQLQETEQRFQWLADFILEAAVMEGTDGILFANQAMADLLKTPNSLDLLGRSVTSFVTSSQRGALHDVLSKARLDHQAVRVDVLLHRQDGTQIEATLSAIDLGYHGQPAHLFVFHDHREERRVEAAMNHLANFARENPNPILMFARDGRLTYHNGAAMEMAVSFGREHPAACVPPQAASIVENCLVSGKRRSSVVWEQNGRTFSWSFFPHGESGVVHAFVVEVTEQQRLEEQLRHSQRLEGVGRLAGGVAHEYSNLLTVIGGQVDLLSHSEDLSPKGREALQQMLHAVKRAEQLTRQLQTFSRRNHVHRAPLQINLVLAEIGRLLASTLPDHVRLTLEPGEDTAEILADRSLIEQVLLNLALNARDAMPEGGELTLSTKAVEFEGSRAEMHPESRSGRFVRLSVSDTGCGIDPRLLPYVFEPFFTTKNPESVSGLGLSTSHGIVKQHNGWIELRSQRGVGTTVSVFLPVGPSWCVDSGKPLGSPSAALPSEHTVLLVEDEPAVRYTLKSLLEQEGYTVLEASGALEALALWQEKQQIVSVLLTDLVMPNGISGQELAKHLMAAKPQLRIIYTSGYNLESVSQGLSLEAGVNFLQKPFQAHDVTRALERQASEISCAQ